MTDPAQDRSFPRLPVQLREPGLYAIADADAVQARGLDLVETILAFVRAEVPLLQLRAKGQRASFVLEIVKSVKEKGGLGTSALIINDRADLAELTSAVGVHVGQEDMPVRDVRRIYPDLVCGVSTHDLEELEQALSWKPDYVAFGPVFPTESKADASPSVGLSRLIEARKLAQKAQIPLVAIGGIGPEDLASVAKSADWVAMIGGLLPSGPGGSPYQEIERRSRAADAIIRSRGG